MAVSRSRRQRLVVALGLLSVTLAVLVGWWVYDHFTLNPAEQHLVGTWAYAPNDGVKEGTFVEFVVRDNRTLMVVSRDIKTGAVELTSELYDWWGMSDGLLSMRERKKVLPARQWFAWWNRPRRVDYYVELRLASDGPDLMRYTLTRADRVNVLADPLPTGTWTRVKAE